MAEALGAIGSVIAIAEASLRLFRFACDVIKADNEREKFVQRLSCLDVAAEAVDECRKIRSPGPWIQKLNPEKENSPAYGLVRTIAKMEGLLKIDVKDMSLNARIKNYKWHSEKKDLDACFSQLNMHCTTILLVLEMNGLGDISRIQKVTEASAKTMKEIEEFLRIEKRDWQSSMDNISSDLKHSRTATGDIAEAMNKIETILQHDLETRQNTANRMAEDIKESKSDTKEAVQTTKTILQRLDSMEEKTELEKAKVERKNIEQWLSPLEFPSRQQAIFERAAPFKDGKIGQWFLDTEAFKIFREGRIKELRGWGKRGAGKTVLSSIVVDDLMRNKPHVPLICVYLEDREKLAHTPKNIRGSMLKQLVQFKESGISPAIRDGFIKASRTNSGPVDADVTSLLKSEIGEYPQVYVVVDGADEASIETRAFIGGLRTMSSALNILVMSRADDELSKSDMFCDICDAGKERPCINYHLCLDCEEETPIPVTICCTCAEKGSGCPNNAGHILEDMVEDVYEVAIITPAEDIEFFLRTTIEKDMPRKASSTDLSSRRFGVNELVWRCYNDRDLFTRIVSSISTRANGTFLNAVVFLKAFMRKNTLRDINAELRKPKSDGVFPYLKDDLVRVMKQEEEKADLARTIFLLIYFAKRNLKLKELQQMLATRPGDTFYDVDGELEEGPILNVTKGFVLIELDTVDGNDCSVRFDHSISEFFDKYWQEWFPSGRIDIALTCLTFLKFPDFTGQFVSEADFKLKENEFPFISYAVQFWGDHVREAGSEAGGIIENALEYLQDSNRMEAYIYAAWTADTHHDDCATRHHDKWDIRRSVHPLHVCAWFDLDFLVPRLISNGGKDLNVRELTHGQTPLIYACRKGSVQTIRRLLELGADVNIQSKKGCTALIEAIIRLKKDPDNNSAEEATLSLEIVKVLQDPNLRGKHLDVNIPNPRSLQRTALFFGIAYGQSKIALEILKNPRIDVNWHDLEGTTALSFAICQDLANVIEELVNAPCINIDYTEKVDGRTALHFAALFNLRREVVEALLSKGADPDIKDSSGHSAIWNAARTGNEEAFEVLAKHPLVRSTLTSVDRDGRTLLHWAAASAQIDILRLVIGLRLPINAQDTLGMTALHHACQSGNPDVAELLLMSGADRELKDNCVRTPFAVAWQYDHADLMERCKTQLCNCNKGDLPIWSLAMRRDVKEIQSAVASKMRLTTTEPRTQRTALHCVLVEKAEPSEDENTDEEDSQIQILKLLLDVGEISPNEVDSCKQSPLHFAAMYGNLRATKLLLEYDADIDQLDCFDNSALSIAQKNKRASVTVALIEDGAFIDPARANREELLFQALEVESPIALRRLIAAGANRMAVDDEGRTADFVAQQASDPRLLAILKAAKSTWFAPTMNGNTEFPTVELENAIDQVEKYLDKLNGKENDHGIMLNALQGKHKPLLTSKSWTVEFGAGPDPEVDVIGKKKMRPTEIRSGQIGDSLTLERSEGPMLYA